MSAATDPATQSVRYATFANLVTSGQRVWRAWVLMMIPFAWSTVKSRIELQYSRLACYCQL